MPEALSVRRRVTFPSFEVRKLLYFSEYRAVCAL